MNTAIPFTSAVGIDHPVIQAPMAGGGDTPELVAAVCNAGGLGCVGAAYLAPDRIREASSRVRALTNRPFGINLFAPMAPPVQAAPVQRALERVTRYYTELGLDPPGAPSAAGLPFAEQLQAVLESGATVFSFTFGMLPERAMAAVKARFFVMGTATTVAEAVALEGAGVDAVVAQGAEAGGHRGTFAGPFDGGMVGTIALVPQIADAVRVPVVASGGVMDGRGIAAALALGASAAQLGTAFLTCDEAGVPDAYKDAILSAREDGTRITRAFSGRPARGIVNRFMEEVEQGGDEILPFPLQNALTRPLRTAAAQRGRAEFLSLWAGQGLTLARRQPAADLVARLVRETAEALARIT